jgi:hypothetical protein
LHFLARIKGLYLKSDYNGQIDQAKQILIFLTGGSAEISIF